MSMTPGSNTPAAMRVFEGHRARSPVAPGCPEEHQGISINVGSSEERVDDRRDHVLPVRSERDAPVEQHRLLPGPSKISAL